MLCPPNYCLIHTPLQDRDVEVKRAVSKDVMQRGDGRSWNSHDGGYGGRGQEPYGGRYDHYKPYQGG